MLIVVVFEILVSLSERMSVPLGLSISKVCRSIP